MIFGKKKEAPSAPPEEKGNIKPQPTTPETLYDLPKRFIEVETRLCSVEMKLFELRKLLLEKDTYSGNPESNKLSKFGRGIRRSFVLNK